MLFCVREFLLHQNELRFGKSSDLICLWCFCGNRETDMIILLRIFMLFCRRLDYEKERNSQANPEN